MKTEATILKHLMAMRGEKTIVLVTQRLPELISADQILVLDSGCIMERGTHDELLDQHESGWYARIFRQQARTILQPLNESVEAQPDEVA